MFHLQIELFLLLAAGYFLGKSGLLTARGRSQMIDMVVTIILPCSILSSFQMNMEADLWKETGLVLSAAMGIQILYWILNHFLYMGFQKDERISCRYATMVTNASFIGMPIAGALYGQTGLLYASIFVIPQRIFMWLYGLPLYTTVSREDAVKKVVTHPCVISVFAGIGIMILYNNGIFLPKALMVTLKDLGGCTTALCMMAIGNVFSEMKFTEMFSLHALVYSIYRLFLIPLAVMLLLKMVPMDSLSRGICVLLSAMPAPTTVVILAEKYNRNPRFASKLMVTSTLLSLISIPVIVNVI